MSIQYNFSRHYSLIGEVASSVTEISYNLRPMPTLRPAVRLFGGKIRPKEDLSLPRIK
jgi:hypothetical protein